MTHLGSTFMLILVWMDQKGLFAKGLFDIWLGGGIWHI